MLTRQSNARQSFGKADVQQSPTSTEANVKLQAGKYTAGCTLTWPEGGLNAD
ncbi:hypothetical protein [Pedobacter sp. Leaf176]|uniref:hypothetical protein n=1 Tax=Pedobacter sp. Leaf176 TaxID=1736286 RepID=UPI000A532FB8|nr:hypothetical protein [Pedobacter sp. Leaf176]